MSIFKFQKLRDFDNKFDNTIVTFDVEEESLPEIVGAFEDFLKACGFKFDGILDIVDDESEAKE